MYVKRFTKLLLGLAIFSFGYYLSIQANIGLAPWNAFSQGIAMLCGTTIGVITSLTAVVIMGIDLLLKEQIGWGTILDTILVGAFIDLFSYLEAVPFQNTFLSGLIVLLLGIVFICIGSYFYISAALSAGPRDTLMVALCKRFPKTPVAVIRICIEGSALLVGFLCGAKVGIGTVITVFGLGLMLQLTFHILKFDVTTVQNENVVETCRNIMARN